MARTRMNKGRKRPSYTTLKRQYASSLTYIRRLQRELAVERKKWEKKCSKGHLVRYDRCDLSCLITKTHAAGSIHEWAADRLPYSAGWWWRIPLGWWQKFWSMT